MLHLRRPRQLVKIVEKLNAFAHAEVVDRKYVGPVKRENHEHVHRPRADPIDHRQHCEQRLVVHIYNRRVRQNPVLVLSGQVVEVAGFSARNPDLAELLRRLGEDRLGDDTGLAAAQADEARVDRIAGLVCELLVENATG